MKNYLTLLFLLISLTASLAAQQKLRIVDSDNQPIRNTKCYFRFSKDKNFAIPFTTNDEGRSVVYPKTKAGTDHFEIVISNYGVSKTYAPEEEVYVQVKKTSDKRPRPDKVFPKNKKNTVEPRRQLQNSGQKDSKYEALKAENDSLRERIADLENDLLQKISEAFAKDQLLLEKDRTIEGLITKLANETTKFTNENNRAVEAEKIRDYYKQKCDAYAKEIEEFENLQIAEDFIGEDVIWVGGKRFTFDKTNKANEEVIVLSICDYAPNLSNESSLLNSNKKLLKRLLNLYKRHSSEIGIEICGNVKGKADDEKLKLALERAKQVHKFLKGHFKYEIPYKHSDEWQKDDCVYIKIKKKVT